MIFRKKIKPSYRAYAVVTGAGSGIGRSFAQELARRGSAVVCSDINLETAKETVTLIQSNGGTAYAYPCDVTKAEEVQKLADEAEKLLQHPVTLVINNAGVGLGGKFDDLSLEDWQWCININLWGVIYGCQAFVPKFKTHKRGAIINVSSAASFGAAPEMSAYNVTKAGVLSLSETLSAELKRYNIAVNVLCPTLVPTNIIKSGRIPGRYSKLVDYALMNLAFTTSDKVAKLTLDRLDQGKLYTVPQIDARFFWRMKRISPAAYAKFLGFSYKFMK